MTLRKNGDHEACRTFSVTVSVVAVRKSVSRCKGKGGRQEVNGWKRKILNYAWRGGGDLKTTNRNKKTLAGKDRSPVTNATSFHCVTQQCLPV